MAKTRKESRPNVKYDRSFFVDRHEIMKLTKMAKAWEFTCSFCFKKFPSAQAMAVTRTPIATSVWRRGSFTSGDPIGYRKRAFIMAMKEAADHHHHHQQSPKYDAFPSINGPPNLPFVDAFDFNAPDFNNNNYFCQSLKKDDKDSAFKAYNNNNNNNNSGSVVVMNFLPLKELSLAESVGGADAKGKACMEFNGGGYGIMDLDQKLDLTLKL